MEKQKAFENFKIGIFGVGSIGGTLGAFFRRVGLNADLLCRDIKSASLLRSEGMTITGTENFHTNILAYPIEESSGNYDIIFIASKAINNKQNIQNLLPLIKRTGIFCTLQNGLPEYDLAEIVGSERIISAIVHWAAIRLQTNIIQLISPKGDMRFVTGSLFNTNSPNIDILNCLLEKIGQVATDLNFIGARWAKLLINAGYSSLGALTGLTYGDLVDQKDNCELILGICKECIDVAKAINVRLGLFNGRNLENLLDYKDEEGKKIALSSVPEIISQNRNHKSSMLQDIEKGNKTEIDLINGIICRFGYEKGISVPMNKEIVYEIHKKEIANCLNRSLKEK